MRPKKRILLIDTNETRQATCRFMLTIRGFLVISATSAAEGHALFQDCNPDLVIATADVPNLQSALNAFREGPAHVPQMVLAPAKGECPIVADAVIYGTSAEEIYERARMMSARKSGPRKRPPVSASDTHIADGVYQNWIVQNGQVVARGPQRQVPVDGVIVRRTA